MRIVIVNAVYPPEPVVSAQIGRDLAIYLAQADARVTVLRPPPSRPFGVQYPDIGAFGRGVADRVGWKAEDEVRADGIAVLRLSSYTAPQSRLWPRMRESWSFGRQACRCLRHRLPDTTVVYANTWPLLSQALLARYCARRRIPFVLHIQDIYPESLWTRWPRFSSGSLDSALRALDRWIAQRATRVVVISENMRRTYVEDRGLAPEKVITVPNWVDEGRFAQLPERRSACARYEVPEECFTFLYMGNVGPAAGVTLLIEAFHAARIPQARLVIAGDGSAKADCVELARRLEAKGIQFLSDREVANVPLLQSLGHVCLLPMRRGVGMYSVPSKLMAYLLSAKPVLATVDASSNTADCLREAQCGWVGEPEQVGWLARKMAEVASMTAADLTAMGLRGRAYGIDHFTKASGVRRLADVIMATRSMG